MKICATTLGETAGDLLSMTMKIGYATSSIILIGIFFVTLAAQLISKKYHPLLYWTVILSTSTAGTTISDYIDRTLGIGYFKGSIILIIILVTILTFWRFNAKSLSVENIKTFKIELFYWLAILASNTLGTAFGDCLSDYYNLGFAGAAILVGGLLGLVILAKFFSKISHITLFWIAFVLTRPLGATMGDFLSKPIEKGGLDFGTINTSLILTLVLMAVIFFTNQKKSNS